MAKSSGAIVRRELAPLEFTPEQRKMILNSFLNGATESEAAVLLEFARLRRLNPITKQIHFVKRWDSQKRAEVWAYQVSIDGFRAIAERTGLYAGQDDAEFEYDKEGKLKTCRVRIYRKDWERPVVGRADFSEFAQWTKDKGTQQWKLTQMWATKGHVMLAKCAEAVGLRKAFPEDVGGLHTEEELGAADREEREVNSAPAATRAEQVKAQLAARTPGQTIEAPKQPAKADSSGPPEPPPIGDEYDPRTGERIPDHI